MDREESERLGSWFNLTTNGVFLPVIVGLATLGAVLVAGVILVLGGLDLGAKSAYNWIRTRRRA